MKLHYKRVHAQSKYIDEDKITNDADAEATVKALEEYKPNE